MADETGTPGTTRRELIKKGVFVAPAILTLTAVPSFASSGSSSQDQWRWSDWRERDPGDLRERIEDLIDRIRDRRGDDD